MCQMMLQVRDCYRTTNKEGGEGGTVNVHWIMIIYREAGRRATMITRLLS